MPERPWMYSQHASPVPAHDQTLSRGSPLITYLLFHDDEERTISAPDIEQQ